MAAAKPARTEVETWGNSASKALLRAGIISGEIPADRLPKAVFNMNPEVHGKWKYINWANNLRTLRNAIQRDRSRMQRDAIAYGQTLQIVRARFAPTTPLWHLSDCPTLLAKDVDEGKHKQMKPKDLHKSRPQYMVFSLQVFRKHIYQEVDCRPKRVIRFEKKKKGWLYPELHTGHPRLRDDSETPPN
jgi:hypothetical protein